MNNISNCEIERIAIVGTGKMGASLWEYFIDKEITMKWLTRSDARMQKLINKTERQFKRFVKMGIMSEEKSNKLLNRIEISTDFEILSDVDLVIESVPEKIDAKHSVLTKIFQFIPEHAIVGSNSSSIVPSELSGRGIDAERLCGLHFFFPVGATKIVEFVSHPNMNKIGMAKIQRFMERNNFTVIAQDENNAFLLNMLTMPLACEAFVQAHKVGFQVANDLASSEVFPLGPFRLFDYVGIDIILESSERYFNRIGDILQDKQAYLQFIAFMRLWADAERIEAPDQLLSDSYQYPTDFSFWNSRGTVPQEKDDNETNALKERFLSILIHSCRYAVENDLITEELLDDAWKKVMGSDVSPLELETVLT
ncbi:MAG: 3-hydroxyacyl-CoA dehydrogenase family protein [Candidatus Brocadiaceae bacterium]|nr:3-hydroxyacyl-CoA dehydrogenase family protein [Candidatus Brocadiaceae bacterium]